MPRDSQVVQTGGGKLPRKEEKATFSCLRIITPGHSILKHKVTKSSQYQSELIDVCYVTVFGSVLSLLLTEEHKFPNKCHSL
jgi:hypothetical protein